jgi:dolichyl-phosphate beta-glucosyltransferase
VKVLRGRTSPLASTISEPTAPATYALGMVDAVRTPQDIPTVLLRAPCDLEVLIPARNEACRLPQTLAHTVRYLEAQPYCSSVVVIDNGSFDRTSDLVAQEWSERVPVHLIGCAQPGKGAAVRRGLLTSRARFVGYMDADMATPIDTLDVVLPLLESGWQAVIGSRRVGGAILSRRQPVYRRAGSMAFRAMTKRMLSGITDSQCGFKFFVGDLIRTLARDLRIDGFAFDVELLQLIIRMGIPVTEIPVVWSDDKASTLRALRDGSRALADVARIARRKT